MRRILIILIPIIIITAGIITVLSNDSNEKDCPVPQNLRIDSITKSEEKKNYEYVYAWDTVSEADKYEYTFYIDGKIEAQGETEVPEISVSVDNMFLRSIIRMEVASVCSENDDSIEKSQIASKSGAHMNMIVSDDIVFTVIPESVIQQFCNDNSTLCSAVYFTDSLLIVENPSGIGFDTIFLGSDLAYNYYPLDSVKNCICPPGNIYNLPACLDEMDTLDVVRHYISLDLLTTCEGED